MTRTAANPQAPNPLLDLLRQTCSLLGLMLLGLVAVPASAGQIVLNQHTDLEGLYDPAEGWMPVAEGVWERQTPDGRFERFARGAAGLRAMAAELRTELLGLLDTYLQDPTVERSQLIHSRLELLHELEEGILRAESAPASSTGACQRTFSFGADAQPDFCTNQAAANASYSTDNPAACPEQCTVVAEAEVTRDTCQFGEKTDRETCQLTGTNVGCQASAELSDPPRLLCRSRAFASIYCPDLGLFQSQEDTSNQCNDVPGPIACITCRLE